MKRSSKAPAYIALIYIVFGCAWIFFSDRFIESFYSSSKEIAYFQTVKGFIFVFLSGILIFFLTAFAHRRIRKQEKKIIDGEENYKRLFQNNPIPMWVYDMKSFEFLEVNKASIQSYGYSREEFLNMTIFDIRPEEDHTKLMNNIAVDENIDYSLTGFWRHLKKDGTIIFVEISSHPIEFNKKSAKIVLVIDVTKRKDAEKEIQALIYELDNFVYRASHDLRGPLARLKGLSQVALMETKDETAINYLNLINNSANVLDNTLLRLLSINNLKHAVLEPEEVKLHHLINKIILIKKDVVTSAGISFINEVDEDLVIYSDKNILKLVLQNMLENSIQYRNDDEFSGNFYIKVATEMQGQKVKLFIEDNGIGIEDNETDKIFNIFHRGTLKSNGSGLGLYIAKVAMDKIKGTIRLVDHKKYHTVFELTIPSTELVNSSVRSS